MVGIWKAGEVWGMQSGIMYKETRYFLIHVLFRPLLIASHKMRCSIEISR